MTSFRFWLAVIASLSASIAAAATTPALTTQDWREDLAVIARELPRRHPDLYYRTSKAAWDSAVTATHQRLEGMSRSQAIVALMELVAVPRDGHTAINPLFDPALRFHYYPLELRAFDDGLFVVSADAAHARLVGSRVRRIGERTADEALASVMRTVSSETDGWSRVWAAQRLMMPEILEGLGIAKDTQQLPVVLEVNGREETVRLAPAGMIQPRGHGPLGAIDQHGWVDMRKAAAPEWQRQPGVPYRMEYKEKDRMLYVNYRGVISLDHGESNSAFWRRVFATADSLTVDRFVLDLRENIGGNSFFNRQVVRGLVARPKLDRKDRLFVLTGPRTFSAAMNLVQDLERWTNATLVGEPTGNAVFFFGDHVPVTLPKSGITVAVSSLPWRPYDPRDHRSFIAPALYAPMTSAQYREGRDPSIEAIQRFGSQPNLIAAMESAVVAGDTLGAERLLDRARADQVNRYRTFEADVNQLGYKLLNSGRKEAAIAVFRINARAYPQSANAWDSLGEALAIAGRGEEAIAAYRRALERNPDQSSAQAALRRLGALGSGGAARH